MQADLILELARKHVGDKLRHVSSSNGGEYASPCPLCGGDDRFRIWPNKTGGKFAQEKNLLGTFWCRGCDKKGDILNFLEHIEGLDFRSACNFLNIALDKKKTIKTLSSYSSSTKKENKNTFEARECPVPSQKWQEQALKVADIAHENLIQSQEGIEFLGRRGLPLTAIKKYKLGYLKGENKEKNCIFRARSAFDLASKEKNGKMQTRLWIPRGFTIPLIVKNEVHRIRIRRPKVDLQENQNKYLLLEGSGQAPMILESSVSNSMTAWVIVESELDAMAVHHACNGNVGVISVMTNRGKPNFSAHSLLEKSPIILVALDFDNPHEDGTRAGFQGWEWWSKTYSQAKRWPVAMGKDPGEAFELGLNLSDWINAGLPIALQFSQEKNSVIQEEISTIKEKVPALQENISVIQEKFLIVNGFFTINGKRHWEQAHSEISLENAVLPADCPSIDKLKTAFCGKTFDNETLIICPKTRPTAWWWTYYKYCKKCSGHHECIIDFITSNQLQG